MLTKTNPDGSWSVCGIDWKIIPREFYGALCKLHDYEKTGLNPDEVERLMMISNERRDQHDDYPNH